MSERDLKNPDLINVFRQFAGRRSLPVPEVDDLIELSRLPHADEAASPLHADLLRLSRELEPVSQQLSTDIAAALGQTSVATHLRTASRRAASARRGWRIAAAAMAACLVVAIVVAQRGRSADQQVAAHAVPDRIFAGFEEHNMAASKPVRGDQIFRGNFLPDEIFSSSKPHEG